MFAKLLKYEWKATAGTLGVFSLAMLGVGVMATVILRILVNYGKNISILLGMPMLTMLGGAVMAVAAYVIGVQFFLFIRFYKNKFTDEGYLTFTLPVTSQQILLSSLVNFIVWTVITMVIASAAVLMAALIGTTKTGLVNVEVFGFLKDIVWDYSYLYDLNDYGAAYKLLLWLEQLSGGLLGVIQIMTAITLGSSWAQKHKVLASFGIYYGMNMVVSILGSVSGLLMMLASYGKVEYESMIATYSMQIVLNLALCVAEYFIMNYMVKRKLNLP